MYLNSVYSWQQSELTAVLGQYADVGMNFVSGAPLNERNRVEVLIDDQGLYRETQVTQCDETGESNRKIGGCRVKAGSTEPDSTMLNVAHIRAAGLATYRKVTHATRLAITKKGVHM